MTKYLNLGIAAVLMLALSVLIVLANAAVVDRAEAANLREVMGVTTPTG